MDTLCGGCSRCGLFLSFARRRCRHSPVPQPTACHRWISLWFSRPIKPVRAVKALSLPPRLRGDKCWGHQEPSWGHLSSGLTPAPAGQEARMAAHTARLPQRRWPGSLRPLLLRGAVSGSHVAGVRLGTTGWKGLQDGESGPPLFKTDTLLLHQVSQETLLPKYIHQNVCLLHNFRSEFLADGVPMWAKFALALTAGGQGEQSPTKCSGFEQRQTLPEVC